MPTIQKIVKVTKAQMASLIAGNSIGGHTYDPTHCLYMVDDGLDLPEETGRYFLTTDDDGASYSYELANDSAGSATNPVYFSNGEPVATTYSLNKTVPADAVFTDTKTTAGSSNTTSKIFLIGGGEQTSSTSGVTTYSSDKVYVDHSGTLYAVKTQDLSGTANNYPALVVGGIDTSTHMEFDANEIQAKANGTTTADLHLNADGGKVYLTSTSGSSHKAYAESGYLYSNGTKVSVEGHTHNTTIAAGGTSALDLSANTEYTLTAGGKTFVFKTPVDTKNTAGATNSVNRLLLVGANEQASNSQTFVNTSIYMEDGTLYLAKTQDLSGTSDSKPALIIGSGRDANEALGAHLELDGDEIQAKATATTTANLYLNADGGKVYLGKKNSSNQYAYAENGKLYSEGTEVSKSGHTHTTTIAAGGSNPTSLSANTTYTLTAGGTTAIFKTPVDTKNTAGATDVPDKLFLIGAAEQSANPDTFSNSQVYETNGVLTAAKFSGPLEAVVNDTTNNLVTTRSILAKRKVYTNVIGVANGSSPNNNTWANRSIYFLTVKPKSWTAEWQVKYHINVHLTNESQTYKSSASASAVNLGQLERGNYECMIAGTRGAYTAYSFFNAISHTSYRPFYYHIIHETTETGFNNGCGHKIGVSLTDSYLPVPATDYSSGSAVTTSFYRTFEIIVDEAINCEATLNNTLEVMPDAYASGAFANYTKLSSSYYTTSTGSSNSAGRWVILDGYSVGLRETGDDNTTTQLNMYNSYLKNGTSVGGTAKYITGYSLIGFDKDGKAMAISNRTGSATSYDAGVSTSRVYTDKGFDYTRRIVYTNSSSNFAGDASMNISPLIYQTGVDFRYSDNCVAASSANTLGLVLREPIYLRGTIGTDGLFYLDPITVTYSSTSYKRAWVQPGDATRLGTNPFDANHVYWFIGYPYYNGSYPNSLYQIALYASEHLMTYENGQLRPYKHKFVQGGATTISRTGDTITISSTDTKNTAGSGNAPATFLYLIGADEQAANPQTYSNINCYIDTDNCLYSNGTKVSVEGHTHAAYVNQNAYGKIKVSNGTAKTADEAQDTIEFAAGGDLGVARDGDKITYSYSTPASLKNPNNLAIRVNSEASDFITYDGSALTTITFKPHASTKGALVISDGSTDKTIQLAGVFTDTKNTAGATTKDSTKMWLIATDQSNKANPQTYENSKCYIGTDNCLYSNGSVVLTTHPAITMGTDSTPAQSTLSHGGTFSAITGITKDSNGHVTAITTQSYKLPGSGDTNQTIKAKNAESGSALTFGSNEVVEIAAGDGITLSVDNTANASYISIKAKDTHTGTTAVDNLGAPLYLVGAYTATTSAQTYTNANCYIGTDNCLYSGGHKVLTAHPTVSTTETAPATTLSYSGTFTAVSGLTISNGHVTAAATTTYTMPAGNTAGAERVTSKLYLIGRSEPSTGVTNSHQLVYETNGVLNAKSFAFTNPADGHDSETKATMQYNTTEDCIEFVFA